MSEITVSVGALARPLAEQLRKQGAKVDGVDKYDNDLNSATRLFMRGYMTGVMVKKVRDKILKDVFKNIQPM